MSHPVDSQAREQRTPTNRLFATYLLVAAVALLFSHRPQGWPYLLAGHLLGAAAALGLGPLGAFGDYLSGRFPRTFRIWADWYTIALIPALYTELAILNTAIWNGHYFDPYIQKIDTTLFGGLPSTELSQHLPSLPISEVLHASYLSYYFIIYAPAIILYLQKRHAEFRAMIFTVMLAFLTHYLFFVFFPVQGPRYLFPAPSGRISEGPVFGLTHKLLEAGSARGAAFPSSHLGVSFTQAVITFQYLPRLALVLAICTFGLAIGAVYGGFHYASDMIAGLLMGVAVVLLAPKARLLFGGK